MHVACGQAVRTHRMSQRDMARVSNGASEEVGDASSKPDGASAVAPTTWETRRPTRFAAADVDESMV